MGQKHCLYLSTSLIKELKSFFSSLFCLHSLRDLNNLHLCWFWIKDNLDWIGSNFMINELGVTNKMLCRMMENLLCCHVINMSDVIMWYSLSSVITLTAMTWVLLPLKGLGGFSRRFIQKKTHLSQRICSLPHILWNGRALLDANHYDRIL